MARRHHTYKGSYVQHSRHCSSGYHQSTNNRSVNFQRYIDKANVYMWRAYDVMNKRYALVVTVLLVGLLSLLIQDMSNKIHKTNELKAMKQAVDEMTKEVTKAEAACLTVADNLCHLKTTIFEDERETTRNLNLFMRTNNFKPDTPLEPVQIENKLGIFRRIFLPNRNASHKEIAIMSFIYSDSFTNHKATNDYVNEPSLKTFDEQHK